MTGRLWRVLAALLVAGVAQASCDLSSGRVAGCVAPANEAALLDEFEKEPVLAVVPDGAKRDDGPRRIEACHRYGDHPTDTAVAVNYDLSRDLGPDEVRSLYDPVAADSGWAQLPPVAGTRVLRYCRDVLGQPGVLEIGWGDAHEPVPGEHVRARLSVVIRPADQDTFSQWAEVEAARAGGCRK